MNLTTGKVHDAAQAQTIIEKLPAANITVVMDRGYNDYSLFAWLSKRGTTFVTRLKDNAATTTLKKGCRSEGDNYGDYQFEFDSLAVNFYVYRDLVLRTWKQRLLHALKRMFTALCQQKSSATELTKI